MDDGLRLVARRPLTVAELRDRLLERGHVEGEVERAIARLLETGILDDRRLAAHFIVTRSARLGHGRARLLRDLGRRGVDPRVAREAWDRSVRQGDVDPDAHLRGEIAKRVEAAGGRLEERAYRRVYNSLLRAGCEPGAVESALQPYRAGPGEPDLAEGTDDDFP